MESGCGDIAADIFRAKTAGRYSDRHARDADDAAFRDFQQRRRHVQDECPFYFGDHVLRHYFVILSISETLRLVTSFLPFYVKTQYCLLIRVYLIIFLLFFLI